MSNVISRVSKLVRQSLLNESSSSVEEQVARYMAPRMKDQENRQEIWYLTLSDPNRGIGLWIHHELVYPSPTSTVRTPDATDSRSALAPDTVLPATPYMHGWIAYFENNEEPLLERFGPEPLQIALPARQIPAIQGCSMTTGGARGSTGTLCWEIHFEEPSKPLFTFPRLAVDYDLLPATQMLPVPSSAVSGKLEKGDKTIDLSGSRGGIAHIYGRGSAKRWAWLHADLGEGDLLEIVAAISKTHHPPLLGPLAFVQLRLGGCDWPLDPLITSACFRTSIGLPTWKLVGRVGLDRLSVEVTIPDRYAVTLTYTDPDGSTATCTNCEIADAHIVFERQRGPWSTTKSWMLEQSAHAEVGTRP
ncbi:MAG: hypothetical protein M1131_04495 [Actinobacteria bacterium]|nr:hypothetical protein [Actinomycetota bacterium]MCL6094680.1 hypothetical protein [Actinomycetota bacterium]